MERDQQSRPVDEVLLELDLAELRDAVNNSRACLRGLYKLTRNANQLVADLEQRLEAFDTQLQRTHRQREAQEAQHAHQNTAAHAPARA